MPSTVESLFWITLCAVLAPLVVGLALRRKVPEVVILLVLGVLIGPHVLDLAVTDEGVGVLRELGLGMLFLLAATRSRWTSWWAGVADGRWSHGSAPWPSSCTCSPRG